MNNTQNSILILLLISTIIVKSSAQNVVQDSLIKERIQFIEHSLEKTAAPVNRWWYGWLGAYSAATAIQGTIALANNDLTTRQDMTLGAATTFLGAALQIITPINTSKDAKTLSLLTDSTQEALIYKLSIAENLLKTIALKEKAGRSWQIHGLNQAVNLGSGLITWLGFKRSIWDGVANFLINTVITETQIWTQPTQSLKDYQHYNRKYKTGQTSQKANIETQYLLSTYPGGVSLKIVF